MSKPIAFARLDFITVKPYLTLKNLLIFLVLSSFLTVTSDSGALGVSVGMIMATLFMGYPFALGEKSDLDALYAMLSVSRKTVVRGRYLFALLLDAGASLLTGVLGTAASLAVSAYDGSPTPFLSAGPALLVMPLIFLFIQAVQIPVFFRVGYTRARMFTVFPFVAVAAATVVVSRLSPAGSLPAAVAGIINSGMLPSLLCAALLLAVFISYRLSLAFYKKREF